MEEQEFTSDDLNHSLSSLQVFKEDRFIKGNNYLNIPDTIPEQYSGELTISTNSVKSDGNESKNLIKDSNPNQSLKSDQSSNSTILAIDDSFLKDFERKLLEDSSSEEDKSFLSVNKGIDSECFRSFQRKLGFNSDSISTPLNELKKQINALRDEMAETNEFHDLEIRVLQEEKSENINVGPQNYFEWYEKYMVLMELYTTLKTEYENYRKEQEKVRDELHYKTADCLESLCSQIEASDSSLNFSGASFVSVNAGIRNSTMMGDVSEVETTVIQDATVLAHDPLSTSDVTFRTPMTTPFKSARKIFPQGSSSKGKRKESEARVVIDAERTNELLNIESALYDKMKELQDMEKRLFKTEELSSMLQNECERLKAVYIKENETLKESLSNNKTRLEELTQKLITETVGLNPSLKESLTDLPESKILALFIETIMESCKTIQGDLIKKFTDEKMEWEKIKESDSSCIQTLRNQIDSLNEQISNHEAKMTEFHDLKITCDTLKERLSQAEDVISTRNEEIRLLQSHNSNVRLVREEEKILKLESQLSSIETEKKEIESRCLKLEEMKMSLEGEISSKENRLRELEDVNTKIQTSLKDLENSMTKSEIEKEDLKKEIQKSDEVISSLKVALESLKESNVSLENALDVKENRLADLENSILKYQSENDDLKKKIQELDNVISGLKVELENFRECKTNFESEASVKDNRLKELEASVENLKSENDVLRKEIQKSKEIASGLEEEIESFKENKTNYDSEINSRENRLRELEGFIEKIQTENEYLKSEIQTSQDIISGLKEDLESKKNHEIEINSKEIRLTDLEDVVEKLKSENENLKEEIKKSDEIISGLKRDLESKTNIQKEVLIKENRLCELEDSIEKLKAENEDLKKEIQKSDDVIAGLKGVLESLKESKMTLETDYNIKQNNLNDLENSIVKLQFENDDLKMKVQKSEDVISGLKEEVESFKEIKTNLETELEGKGNRLKDLENSLIKSRTENEDLKKSIEESNEVISGLKSDLETCKENLSEEMQVNENRLKNLEDSILKFQTENEDLKKSVQASEDVISVLKGELESFKEIKTNLESSVEKFQNENEDLKKEIRILEETIHGLKEELRRLGDKSELELELSNLKQSCEILKDQLSRSEKTISSREEEIRSYESRLIKAQEDLAAADDVIIRLKSHLTSAENDKSELENLCETSLIELKSLKSENEDLKEKISKFEEVIADLKAQLKRFEDEKLKNEVKVTELNDKIDFLQKDGGKFSLLVQALEERKKNLTDILSNNRDMTFETLAEKMESTLQLKEPKFLSLFADTIAESQKGVRDALLKEFTVERNEWEAQKSVDATLIKNLQNQIKLLREESDAQDACRKLCDDLKAELTKAEDLISSRESEIRNFEAEVKVSKQNLDTANESVKQLKSQLSLMEIERLDLENRYESLQKDNTNLQTELSTNETVRNENDNLKLRIQKSEEVMSSLKLELEEAKREQIENELKLKELMQEIEELKKENGSYSQVVKTLEESKKCLMDGLKTDETDLPSDRIPRLITKTMENFEIDTSASKILSIFVNAIEESCKGVQNELIKKFGNEKAEWEIQKNTNLNTIEDLNSRIKALNEENIEVNVEKNDLKNLYEALRNEVDVLQSRETDLKQISDDLARSGEAVQLLKSQLSLAESERIKIESRCKYLEEDAVGLKAEIETKETVLRGLKESKELLESENVDLKKQNHQSEQVIMDLKRELKLSRDEYETKESKMEELKSEINFLKKEKENLSSLSDKLQALEENKKNWSDIFSDIQSCLNIPADVMSKLLSGDLENRKIFSERINTLLKAEAEDLKIENKRLTLGNENLKEKVRELSKLMRESASNRLKEENANLNTSLPPSMGLRSKTGRSDLYMRRLDKLEEINHNLTEVITRILTLTDFPNLEKIKLSSVRDFPNVSDQIMAHINKWESKMKELKTANAKLDEECDSYAKTIKDLKKEAVVVWKTNKEKTEAMEAEIARLKGEQKSLESEKRDLVAKISKLESECQKLKSSKIEGSGHSCNCGTEMKKINDLKRTILIKEQKILELQDLESQNALYKSQIKYLENALEQEKKKTSEEREKNRKLQMELDEVAKNEKANNKKSEENEMLEELRMRGSFSRGVVQEYVDKEKMRKLSKDIGILKELCRARYAEIKRLEAENASLKHSTPKNSNQMDSPIRTRAYNTRSKNVMKDMWKTEVSGKENVA